MKSKSLICLSLVLTLTLILSACQPREKTPLVVFSAGSLIQPMADMEAAFEAANPDIDVLNEYHGSIQVIRHVTELHESIDVVATADQALIPMLMYASAVPETGQPYANWYVRFATNKLGLAYSKNSRYADEINSENWMKILQRKDVKVGIADPRFDAAGYRALMVFQLAGKLYDQPTLFFDMFDGAFKYPVTVENGADGAVVHVPELLESQSGSHILLRGASIQLIALLESGDLDYAFEYESVIRQHWLGLVELPAELNLGDAGMEQFYEGVTVNLDFQRFASVQPVFRGEQIGYGITIPSNAPHPREAERFVEFVLGPEGQKIMAADYQPLLDPLVADGYENLPAALQALTQPAP
ncbi:tungstate ABC transporter binding protein WtpA [Longilinea arvoryzae]|uniref:Tungstate ABC transporter binding protein WtpA n=1 Tax=Longilinea arvoryzae TaxID=360412 RepID=A0A0S7BGX4_9CHLR|nr:tungstate ABC transporter substrate-binding protein WtpA [Longilinea arvoryzae]GAP12965.1 tungstate ABC transporter binding protein WtpA [Longilinea arvoryzae]